MGSAKSSAAMLIKNNAATQLVSLLHRPAHSAILRQCYCWLLENCLQCPTRQFSNRRQRKKQKNRHRPVPSEASDFSIAIFRVPTLWEFKKKKHQLKTKEKCSEFEIQCQKRKKTAIIAY